MSRLFLLIVPLLIAGCSGQNSANNQQAKNTSAEKEKKKAKPVKQEATKKKNKAKQENKDPKKGSKKVKATKATAKGKAKIKKAKTKKAKASKGKATKKQSSASKKTFESRRVLMLAPGGPLVIELRMSIDGKPFSQMLDKLVNEALIAADTDKDGKATWKELTTSDRFKFGQYGNLPFGDDSAVKQVIELYDINRNDLVDRDEVPRFLTRNYGGAKPFSLRPWRVHFIRSRRGSALRKWLDLDENGRLSKTEIAKATVRLQSRDANDDEILVQSEFVDSVNDPRTPRMATQSGRRGGAQISVALDNRVEWENVHYAMQQQYSDEEIIRKKDWPALPKLFAKLDENADGKVSEDELRRITKIEPHLSFEVRFDGKVKPSQMVVMRPVAKDRFATPPEVSQGNSITVKFPGFEMNVFANDQTPNQQSQQYQTAFNRFDGDKNKYLDEEEYPEQNRLVDAPFAALDRDKDGKVYYKDVEYYLKGRFAAVRSQIRARMSDDDDPLFLFLDKDNDGRLNGREIKAAAAMLRSIDKNKDGQVSVTEIPVSLSFALARGNPQQGDRLFALPARQATANPKAPDWFQKMDENRDGEISRREFLGSTGKFKQWDRNGDGFLSPTEVVKK